MATHQQPDTDTMNNIYNNELRKSHDEVSFVDQAAAINVDSNPTDSNDDNNNSNNLGPETDVDAVEGDSQAIAAEDFDGEAMNKLNFTEIDDMVDHAETMDFNPYHSAAIYDGLDNKEVSFQNNDSMKSDPFMSEEIGNFPDVLASAEDFLHHETMGTKQEDFVYSEMNEDAMQAEEQHSFDDYVGTTGNISNGETNGEMNTEDQHELLDGEEVLTENSHHEDIDNSQHETNIDQSEEIQFEKNVEESDEVTPKTGESIFLTARPLLNAQPFATATVSVRTF